MRNTKPQPTHIAVIQRKAPEPQCWLDGCHAKGEHHVVANAYLCTMHFLADRVRQNLAGMR